MEEISYEESILKWRKEMDERLRAENSWLALAGLFWLEEGKNSFGTAKSNDILLPSGSAAEEVGYFEFLDSETKLVVTSDETVQVDGETLKGASLQPDVSGSPSIIELGALRMMVIQRGDQYAIRLWDNQRVERQTFGGRQWFPIDRSYLIEAEFVSYDPPKPIIIPDMLGNTTEEESYGYVEFQINGQGYQLGALGTSSDGLFLIFSDLTNGDSTYPSGRFLSTYPVETGKVDLDFNCAINPPCAFTKYATCPLPPEQNRLDVAIMAGEMYSKE